MTPLTQRRCDVLHCTAWRRVAFSTIKLQDPNQQDSSYPNPWFVRFFPPFMTLLGILVLRRLQIISWHAFSCRVCVNELEGGAGSAGHASRANLIIIERVGLMHCLGVTTLGTW